MEAEFAFLGTLHSLELELESRVARLQNHEIHND